MNSNDKQTDEAIDEEQDLENVNNPDENSILNFEEIFCMETSDRVPKQAASKIKPNIINPELPACPQFQPVDMHDSNISEKEPENPEKSEKMQLHPKQKISDLFTEYLTLRQKQQKTDEDVSIISEKMERLFDAEKTDIIETMTGKITRAEDNNGNRRWILEVSGV